LSIAVPRIAILVAFAVSACASRPPATLTEVAEAYVRLTLQFAQHQPSLVETWLGPDSWRPGARVPVADLDAALDELIARTNRARDIDRTEDSRREYLRGQLRALKVVARRLSGDEIAFDSELNAAFADRAPKLDAIDRSIERTALERELPGEGALVDRIAAFRRRFVVPSERVEAVFSAAVDACRRATMPRIELPSDERVAVSLDMATDWGATAHYQGRHRTQVRISGRGEHDVADLLHIACHETYPGHHVQNVLIEDALVRGRGWAEFDLIPAFGPHLVVTEGWAEIGVELAMPAEVTAQVYRQTLMPLAGLPTADAERLARVADLAGPFALQATSVIGRYLDNRLSFDETRRVLRDETLILSPDRLIALAERRRTAAVVYGVSRHALASAHAGLNAAGRWRKLHDAFTVTPFTFP
jgi:hypothetical protein